KSERARQLDDVAGAISIIWLGIAILADMSWGWFILGLGIIVAANQIARWRLQLRLDPFWVVCGAVFLVGGLWRVFGIEWPLAPVLLILLGLFLLGRGVLGFLF